MSSRPSARPTRWIRIRWTRVAVLLVVAATVAGLVASRLPGSSSATATSPIEVLLSERPRALGGDSKEHRGALGDAGGRLPGGTTVFDDELPGVANLDAALLGALRQAATDAAQEGVTFEVDSGWRSAEYQQQLLDEAIAKYGSEAEAARWVATPTTSAHVSGNAVDLAHDAATWLSAHGAAYGLCQIYGNEPWHYELRPEARRQGCPPTYVDAAHDPRLQESLLVLPGEQG